MAIDSDSIQVSSDGQNVIMGPNGIRAGWRLLLFLFLFIAIASGIGFGVRHVPAIRAWHKAYDPKVMAAPTQDRKSVV